jgi:sensor histidine kinase YesM
VLSMAVYFAAATHVLAPCGKYRILLTSVDMIGAVVLASFFLLYIVDFLLLCIGHQMTNPPSVWARLLYSVFLSAIFSIGGYAYERVRIRLIETEQSLRERLVNEQRLEKLRAQAELQALQARINPHFLFNTLNSIASLIAIDPSKAEGAVCQLSQLFRTTLRSSLDGKVSLRQSLEQAENYLRLERLRLGERLHYSFEVSGDADRVFLPDLILQPLVENSIKHGISPLVRGGTIQVNARIGTDYCELEVCDDGAGWLENSPHGGTGHGLTNIRERMRLLYGEEFRMDVDGSGGGFRVRLFLPLVQDSRDSKPQA